MESDTRHRWSRRTSFWLVVSAQVLVYTGSNLPTPLFPIYERRYGFHSAEVTLIFGVYVGVLIPTLLLLGPVADQIGRKPLLVAGIGATAVSSAAFATAQGVAWLFVGEIVSGLGVGAVMACVAASIRELHPNGRLSAAALAASVAAAAGIAARPPRERRAGIDDAVAHRVAVRARHRAGGRARRGDHAHPRTPATPVGVDRTHANPPGPARDQGPVHERDARWRGQLHVDRMGVRSVTLVSARRARDPCRAADRRELVRAPRRRRERLGSARAPTSPEHHRETRTARWPRSSVAWC